jgi:hypothetical protein
MGYAKQQMMEAEQRGWAAPEKAVCTDCLRDSDLEAVISSHSTDEPCSYCGSSPSAPLHTLMEAIDEGVRAEWQDVENAGIYWETREGGWQGVDVTDTYDLFHDVFDVFENEELRQDVINAYSIGEWVLRDFCRIPEREVLSNGWARFSAMVKHETRFVFLLDPQMRVDYGEDYIPPGLFLEKLGRVVTQLGLIRELPAGTIYHRARAHQPGLDVRLPEALAAPRRDDARFANRMSPVGIPMFYGATDLRTCLAELGHAPNETCCTSGTFLTARPVNVLDLTKLPAIPGPFSPPSDQKDERASIQFLHEFARDVSRPVERDNLSHIEYVPTQVVTEYFRRAFRTEPGEPVYGILYASAKQNGGVCCVLFFDNEQTCGIRSGWQEEAKGGPFGDKSPRWWLGLDPGTVEARILQPDGSWAKASP